MFILKLSNIKNTVFKVNIIHLATQTLLSRPNLSIEYCSNADIEVIECYYMTRESTVVSRFVIKNLMYSS